MTRTFAFQDRISPWIDRYCLSGTVLIAGPIKSIYLKRFNGLFF